MLYIKKLSVTLESGGIFYKNSSFAFSCVQDFFNIFAATAVITGFTSLACTGQRDTQRMQEMHLVLSVVLQLSGGIAPAGHFCAHRPQEVQECFTFGIMPVSECFEGRLPGISGTERLPEIAF